MASSEDHVAKGIREGSMHNLAQRRADLPAVGLARSWTSGLMARTSAAPLGVFAIIVMTLTG